MISKIKPSGQHFFTDPDMLSILGIMEKGFYDTFSMHLLSFVILTAPCYKVIVIGAAATVIAEFFIYSVGKDLATG